MTTGFFITLEGGEGAGKSTQARLLAKKIEESGRDVVITREPGGSPGAEEIRTLLVTGDVDRWTAEAECLLNYAARDDHLNRVIRPALEAGKSVICDRFMDSTRAYQGFAGGVDLGFIDMLEKRIVGDARPDLTLIFDISPEVALLRTKGRDDGGQDRFERKPDSFHEKLRSAFQQIAEGDPDRCIVINADQPEDSVAVDVWLAVSRAMRKR